MFELYLRMVIVFVQPCRCRNTAVDHRVRQSAYFGLKQRGETKPLAELLEVARTGSGNVKAHAIADLVGCQYEKVVVLLVELYGKADGTAKVRRIRDIAMSKTKAAFGALKKIFMEPEHRLPTRLGYTNVTFLGIHFSNLEGSMEAVVGLLELLPRKDYRRRAALLNALANAAGARDEAPWTRAAYEALRRVAFNRKEIPQMRLLALDYLRKDIRLEDAMNIKRGLRKESRPMQRYLSDHLLEFF